LPFSFPVLRCHKTGAAIVAAAKDPRIRCIASLAPVDTMPSSILTVKKVHVPINIIVAKDDWLASADKNSVPIYKNAHAPKQFHILSGGGNAYFYDGEGVHRQRQLRITRFFLTTWFNLYLRQVGSLIFIPPSFPDFRKK